MAAVFLIPVPVRHHAGLDRLPLVAPGQPAGGRPSAIRDDFAVDERDEGGPGCREFAVFHPAQKAAGEQRPQQKNGEDDHARDDVTCGDFLVHIGLFSSCELSAPELLFQPPLDSAAIWIEDGYTG